jgi:outer membrane cobalamin receptor
MLLFSACALCATLALAPSPSPSASALPQIAHVYTTDRSDETLKNAMRTTYVITRDQITRNGYRTIGEALQDVPGVEVFPYGAIGSNYNFSVRGSSASQVLVLVDGLPAPGSLADSVELGNLPTTGVDRIEVVEGGGSTLYGTGAIGGIINVITQRTAQNGATLAYGSFGEKRLEINTDHVQISRVVATNDFGLPNGTVRPDADFQSTAVHVDDARKLGAFDVAVRAGLQADHLGVPGPDSFISTTSRQSDLNGDANIAASRKAAQSELTLQLGGTRQQITFGCDMASDTNCFQAVPSLNTESRVDFSVHNVVSGANEQLLYGIDLSRGTVREDAGGLFNANALAQSAAYLQNKVSAPWGSFYYGVRGERDGALGGEFSPSAGVVVHLSNEASVKANVATAFRAPNASELYFPAQPFIWAPNPGLAPERAKVMDLSITDAHVLGGTSLGWFSNRTNNLIVVGPVQSDANGNVPTPCVPDANLLTAVFQPCNVDHAFIEGLTLDTRTPVFHGFTTALNVTDLYRAQDLDTQTRLPERPVIAANLRLDFTAAPSSAIDSWGAWIHLTGARGFVDQTQPLFDQPAAFTTVNAYVRVRAGQYALVTVRGYNLGNERYAAVGGFPMPGRSFIVELSSK